MENECQKGSRKIKQDWKYSEYSDLFLERLLIFQHFWILLRKRERKTSWKMDFQLILLLAIMLISTAQVGR